jgi:hypothetical protein
MHPAAAELEEKENVQPPQGTVSTVKKSTASMVCACARRNSRPGESGPLAGRPQIRLSEELAYGRGRDCQAEPAELAGDPLVAPAWVLTREAEHQRADLAADRRPTSAFAVSPATGDQPSVPAQ